MEESVPGGRKFALRRVLSPIPRELNTSSRPRRGVWVVPAYPLMPLILGGFCLSESLGDPVTLISSAHG